MERLLGKRRVLAAMMLTGALVVTGVVWAETWDFSPWARGVVGEEPHSEGKAGEVLAADDPSDFHNLILISVDTLRWDMVPPRMDSARLPHLSKLRRDSVRFPLGFSTTTWTLPAHASLLAGRLPIETGALLKKNRMYPHLPLYPQYLRKAGYRTAGFTDGGFVSREYGFQRASTSTGNRRSPTGDRTIRTGGSPPGGSSSSPRRPLPEPPEGDVRFGVRCGIMRLCLSDIRIPFDGWTPPWTTVCGGSFVGWAIFRLRLTIPPDR